MSRAVSARAARGRERLGDAHSQRAARHRAQLVKYGRIEPKLVARLEDHRAHGGLHDEQEGRDEERIMQFEGRHTEEE